VRPGARYQRPWRTVAEETERAVEQAGRHCELLPGDLTDAGFCGETRHRREDPMALHLLKDRGIAIEQQRFTWREISPPTISKLDGDAWTRVLARVAASVATELEAELREAEQTEAEHLDKVRAWTAAVMLIAQPKKRANAD
jgi:hypothetical protein